MEFLTLPLFEPQQQKHKISCSKTVDKLQSGLYFPRLEQIARMVEAYPLDVKLFRQLEEKENNFF